MPLTSKQHVKHLFAGRTKYTRDGTVIPSLCDQLCMKLIFLVYVPNVKLHNSEFKHCIFALISFFRNQNIKK